MSASGEPRKKTCTRGFHAPVLCSTCNNGPCSVYAQAYSVVVAAIRSCGGLRSPDHRLLVHVNSLYPQRLVKHLMSMFLCAVPWEPAPVWNDLQDYVMDPRLFLPMTAPRMFLYHNGGTTGRIVPCCGMVELANGSAVTLSEVSWPPLGVVYAYEWHDKFRDMCEVTTWGQEAFSAKRDVTLHLPDRRVNTHFPLAYGNRRDIERDEEVRLPAFLMHVPPGPLSPTAIATLLKKV